MKANVNGQMKLNAFNDYMLGGERSDVSLYTFDQFVKFARQINYSASTLGQLTGINTVLSYVD